MSEIAVIVGGGPGVSASCARLFAKEGMKVAVAARTPDKPALNQLKAELGVTLVECDASNPGAVANLFQVVKAELGSPSLVVHNIE